jgi:SagB-type dehydrogenase family enzyme
MRSQRHILMAAALAVVLSPLMSLAQMTPGRGTSTAPRRGGGPDAAQRRSLQGVGGILPLPVPQATGSVTVEAALSKFQNLSAPSELQLTLAEVGQLAWSAQGMPIVTTGAGPALAPLANDDRALMKVYLVLPSGVYLYVPPNHSLQQVREGDLRASLASSLLGQQNAPVGGCQVIICSSTRDFTARYGNKARTIMLLLAGQMVQNVQLQAVAMGLTCIGANNVDVNRTRQICGVGRDLEPLCVILVGRPTVPSSPAAQGIQAAPVARPRRAVVIVPQLGFQDEELTAIQRGLQSNSVQVTIASLQMGPVRGVGGTTFGAEMALGQVKADDFGAVILLGGMDTTQFLANTILQALVRDAAAQHRVIAASGNAPGVLANAGMIRGVRVTGMIDVQNMLAAAGANYTGNQVEREGPLITSAGPQFTPLFVTAILDALATP